MVDQPTEDSDLEFAHSLMQTAIALLAEFPTDYLPSAADLPEGALMDAAGSLQGAGIDEILAEPQVQAWLAQTMAAWPPAYLPVFVQSSSVVAQILDVFGATDDGSMMDTLADADSRQLMLALAQFDRETAAAAEPGDDRGTDPLGFRTAAISELLRRRAAAGAPFARTLTTLLGQDALLWLVSESHEGVGKMQPHEFSRTGWHRIHDIENQLAIEQELMQIAADAGDLSKIVVALCWSLVALASFIEPAVFLGERTSHFTALRDGNYTVASGTDSHTLVSFQPASMLPMLKILADGLLNPLLSAADLMWIGAGLVRVHAVHTRHAEPQPRVDERFDLFLSHRGRDAKRPLAEVVQTLPATHGVFLDCMTLPRGVINRSFVYGSLARSQRVLIVDTENFNESEWCRKEAWLTDAMAAQGLVTAERMTLADAAVLINSAGPASRRRHADQAHRYPIAGRVMSDFDYWARTPNLHSLRESGHPTEVLAPLQALLQSDARPDDPAWVGSTGETVAALLSTVITDAPGAEPIDLWASALQLAVAAFGMTSMARSKDEIRRGIDQMHAVLNTLVAANLHREPAFCAHASGYLALLAAASAVQLAGYRLDPRMAPAVRTALGRAALMHDGLLLLDARERGAARTFRLKLVVLLLKGNLGSVGIVQDAADEVHQQIVDDTPLEVLPCVTLYPGMQDQMGLGR